MPRTTLFPRAARLLLVLLCGCAAEHGRVDLLDGDPADPSFWETARAWGGRDVSDVFFALLPGYASVESMRFDAEHQSATAADMTVVGPWIGLPFYTGMKERRLTPEGVAAERGITWTPLFVTSDQGSWPEGEGALEVHGFPLLWTRTRLEDDHASASSWQFLWTLGPLYHHLRTEATEEQEGTRITAFLPVLGAGFGPLLWTSATVDSPHNALAVHGPLLGSLGWISSRTSRPGEGESALRLLVLGILWASMAETDAEGRPVDALHGPLWGMFGTGRDDGDFVIRLFWFEIG